MSISESSREKEESHTELEDACSLLHIDFDRGLKVIEPLLKLKGDISDIFSSWTVTYQMSSRAERQRIESDYGCTLNKVTISG